MAAVYRPRMALPGHAERLKCEGDEVVNLGSSAKFLQRKNMKALELIARAEWWIGNGYKAAGRRFDDMSKAVWKRIEPTTNSIKQIPEQVKEKVKKIKSKDLQNVDTPKTTSFPKETTKNLKEKFDKLANKN